MYVSSYGFLNIKLLIRNKMRNVSIYDIILNLLVNVWKRQICGFCLRYIKNYILYPCNWN